MTLQLSVKWNFKVLSAYVLAMKNTRNYIQFNSKPALFITLQCLQYFLAKQRERIYAPKYLLTILISLYTRKTTDDMKN